jgi:hypothetical protein
MVGLPYHLHKFRESNVADVVLVGIARAAADVADVAVNVIVVVAVIVAVVVAAVVVVVAAAAVGAMPVAEKRRIGLYWKAAHPVAALARNEGRSAALLKDVRT